MFKKKKDPSKDKMRKDLQAHAMRAQAAHDRRKKKAQRLLDKNYVDAQMKIQEADRAVMEAKQTALIKKSMDEIKKTDLKAFKCKDCGTMVDMQNLTCPMCGALYCQWCGAAMDMMNPGLCPRCNRPPMYTPAELVVTKVEDMAPEDRFWEALPTCPKCGATVQADWPSCPICNSKLEGLVAAAPAEAQEAAPVETAPVEEPASDGKKKRRKKDKKKKKKGI